MLNLVVAGVNQSIDGLHITLISSSRWWRHFSLRVRAVLWAIPDHWLGMSVILTRLGRRGRIHGPRAIVALCCWIRHALLYRAWGSTGGCRWDGAGVTQASINGEGLSRDVLHICTTPFIGTSLISHSHDARGTRGGCRKSMCSLHAWSA